jgi:hypothetical protein
MRKIATYEGVVENGHVTLPSEADIPERTRVFILVPDVDPTRTYSVMSPRLAHPEDAKDFELEVIDESEDASL